jgi:hypothetical protein
MDEKINVVNEKEDVVVDNYIIDEKRDEFKDKVTDVVEKIRTQALLLGARTMAITIANIINAEMNKPGKRTMADMRRTVKKVLDFCQKAIDHEVETPKFVEEEEKTDE